MSNSSRDYRRRTQRKSTVTTIISGAVIVAAVVAIIVVIMALIKNSSSDKTADATEPTLATVQPTLYQPGEQGGLTPSEVPTQQQSAAATQQPTTPPATTAPTTPPATTAPTEKTIDPGAAETPVDNSGTGCIRTEAPLNAYTDDNGVLHIITPAGYNWTYQSDGEHVSITCNPHDGQYEFLVTGLVPGSTELAPQYFVNADKTAWVKVPVSAYVDANLRVTVAG